ncbi:hypothetical protein B0T22DRAFT_151971 [Podospora appendiculata]|uniref:Uncharacterized protein n=1 Tax=Podospora appendiculata TaxID=314037 RepID=A0AAE1CC92_9PEZI|nr:hypothetical protein B0T22DRAFT_151971 [Podospora appendiculata]
MFWCTRGSEVWLRLSICPPACLSICLSCPSLALPCLSTRHCIAWHCMGMGIGIGIGAGVVFIEPRRAWTLLSRPSVASNSMPASRLSWDGMGIRGDGVEADMCCRRTQSAIGCIASRLSIAVVRSKGIRANLSAVIGLPLRSAPKIALDSPLQNTD